MSSGVVLNGVSKSFGTIRAIDSVSLEIEKGSFVSLLGPSGCGKTTVLRLIGGFEEPDGGEIRIGGTDVTHVPAAKRPTAMVFQSYALFPNLSVGGNVGYGLKIRKFPRDVIRQKVSYALKRVGLSGYEDRRVSALSGGQQQRVALARAIAVEPDLILFDEPLSNLDLALREQTRAELKALQRDLGTTSVYVTHDQTEALALSDVIAVMNHGRIVETGSPRKLYEEPETAFVASFLGGSNVIPDPVVTERLTVGQERSEGKVLTVRPTSFRICGEEDHGSVPGRLLTHQFLGPYAEWLVEVDGAEGPITLRLWTNPHTAVPESLYIRSAAVRWVVKE